ncbi:hypothetical protein AB0I75_32450 [Streptomyces sp. NPDC050273]|uniref:hypothetical protein n=1 Tax=Streptomyces sp. NPDC050273 TaxID=3154933 RepID=UPI00342CF221
MSEHQDTFMDGDDPELDAWLKTADQAVLSSLEDGMDLVHGLAAITGQDAVAVKEARSEPTAAEPNRRPYDRRGQTQRHRQRKEEAAGSSFYFGDSVTMYGDHNTGLVSNQPSVSPLTPDSRMQDLLQELIHLVRELLGQVSPEHGRTIDGALPYISNDSSVLPQDRNRALLTVAGIAATSGAVGQPTIEAIRAILDLLDDK